MSGEHVITIFPHIELSTTRSDAAKNIRALNFFGYGIVAAPSAVLDIDATIAAIYCSASYTDCTKI